MIISEKKLENAQMELQIEVPENRVEMEYKSVFNKIQNNAKIDGFRKGKAPLELIERKFLAMADQEVAENLLRSIYVDAVTEKNLKPVSVPHFDFDMIARGKSFSFKVIIDVMPEIQIGNYSGLTVEERECKITDEDVQGEIETLRERHATVSKKDEGAKIEKGDLVKFKMKRIDNVEPDEIEKVEFKDFSIIVGKSKDEYTIDTETVGMAVNDEKEIKIKYPKDYMVSDLAGQSVRYLIKIEEINRMELPALDDDFAKDLGEYASLEDLRKEIRKNLESFVQQKAKNESRNKLLKEIIEKTTFDIPNSMIEKEMSALFQRVQERTGYFAEDINQFTSTLGLNPEEFSQKLKEEAGANIKSTLVLSEIAKKEDLKVPEEKFRELIEAVAKRNNRNVEELEKFIADNNSRENIESELLLEQSLDFIYSKAVVKKAKPIPLNTFLKGD